MFNKPINLSQEELIKRIIASKVNVNFGNRWSDGTPHHPKAERIARAIGDIDWLYGGDVLGLKFGGDGDNGEILTYLLDVLFDLEDKELEEILAYVKSTR